jgi:hypothetical protein
MLDDLKAAAYARWLSTPLKQRRPATLQQLAEHLNVEVTTLVVLHNQPWWPDYVEQIAGPWTPGFSRHTTDTVLEALATRAMSGEISAVKMYLQMAGVWDPRSNARSAESEEIDPANIPTAELQAMYEGQA